MIPAGGVLSSFSFPVSVGAAVAVTLAVIVVLYPGVIHPSTGIEGGIEESMRYTMAEIIDMAQNYFKDHPDEEYVNYTIADTVHNITSSYEVYSGQYAYSLTFESAPDTTVIITSDHLIHEGDVITGKITAELFMFNPITGEPSITYYGMVD